MRKRNFKAVAVLTAAAMALAGCGSSQNSPATAAKTEEEAPSKAEGKDSETPAPATDFPTKAIDIVVPFQPGGNVDLSCRIIAEELSRELGQPVNVLNKEGAAQLLDRPIPCSRKQTDIPYWP